MNYQALKTEIANQAEAHDSNRRWGNCTVRAIAAAAYPAMDYAKAEEETRKHRHGRYQGPTWHGWRGMISDHFNRFLVSEKPKTVSQAVKYARANGGTYFIEIRGHVACIRDGELIDWLNENNRHRVKNMWRVTANEILRAKSQAKAPRGRLSETDVRAIRQDTRKHAEIAAQYGIGTAMVSKIKCRTRFAHII